MTTTTPTAAAPAAAAPADPAEIRAAVLPIIEHDLQRMIGPRALEEVPRGALRINDGGESLTGHRDLFVWRTPSTVTVSALGQMRTPVLEVKAAALIDQVMAMRAQDPQAAHARDIANATRTAEHWLFCFENDWRRLADPTHPAYVGHRAPEDPAVVYQPSYCHGGAVQSRDLHSRLLAKTLTAIEALRRRGPHVPEQGCLF